MVNVSLSLSITGWQKNKVLLDCTLLIPQLRCISQVNNKTGFYLCICGHSPQKQKLTHRFIKIIIIWDCIEKVHSNEKVKVCLMFSDASENNVYT